MVQEPPPPPINGLRNTVMNVLENLERYHYVIERSKTLDRKTFLQQTGSSRPWMCSIVRNRKNFRNQSTSIEILTNLNAIINGLFTTLQGSKFIFGLGAPVLPGVNLQARCQNFWRAVDSIAEKHVFEELERVGGEKELGGTTG